MAYLGVVVRSSYRNTQFVMLEGAHLCVKWTAKIRGMTLCWFLEHKILCCILWWIGAWWHLSYSNTDTLLILMMQAHIQSSHAILWVLPNEELWQLLWCYLLQYPFHLLNPVIHTRLPELLHLLLTQRLTPEIYKTRSLLNLSQWFPFLRHWTLYTVPYLLLQWPFSSIGYTLL